MPKVLRALFFNLHCLPSPLFHLWCNFKLKQAQKLWHHKYLAPCIGWHDRIQKKKFKETMQQLCIAVLGCSSVSFRFLSWLLRGHSVCMQREKRRRCYIVLERNSQAGFRTVEQWRRNRRRRVNPIIRPLFSLPPPPPSPNKCPVTAQNSSRLESGKGLPRSL